jgi:hypothetical protein
MQHRTLAELARSINALDNGYVATCAKSHSSTDSQIPGTRLRRQGKGRNGNRLIVKDPKGAVVLDHDTSETYRNVMEAEDQAVRLFGKALDVGPTEILKVDDEVRVTGQFMRVEGRILEVVMKSKKVVRHYVVQWFTPRTRRGGTPSVRTSEFEPRYVWKLK